MNVVARRLEDRSPATPGRAVLLRLLAGTPTPTPYYDDGQISIYHGDCRRVLPALHLAADAIITDPPYGDTSLAWDVPVQEWLGCAARALRPSGSLWCFGSLRMLLAQPGQFAGWRLAQDVVWEKHNGSGFLADRFKRVHEHVVQFYRVGTRWGDVYKHPVTTPDATKRTIRRRRRPTHMGDIEAATYLSFDGGPRLMRSVIRVRSCHGRAVHPTQKPEGIVSPLVEYSVPPGGLVLDPFMGAGTTLLVAKRLGRRAVGIETKEQYCEAAVRRLLEDR